MRQPASLPFLTASTLELHGVRHAFFTREGGVSTGVYASLNGGVGSRDLPQAVAENRTRMADCLGVATSHLLVPYQVHSADALPVHAPWPEGERPRCDGLVTATPGLALGVTGADCGMILFADPKARVIGAVHAGWKGALNGVLEATLEAMEKLGAHRAASHAALGPCIGPLSYEVGPEFLERFSEKSKSYKIFFMQSVNNGHSLFDLRGFIGHRLREAGIGKFTALGLDTYADDKRFYSYRRSVHRKEPDYGRLVGAIVLS